MNQLRSTLSVMLCWSALASIALANSATPITIAFSRSGSTQPRYSTFNGSAWSASAAMPSIGGEAYWVMLKNCPTRNELAFAALDDVNDVNVSIFNGSTWSGATELCSNTNQHADRCMALEYEHVSGDFLIAYWKQSGGGSLSYCTYNGSTFSAESALTLPSGAQIRYISLTQKPYSNELMLLAMNNSGGLYAAVWNGCAFGAVTTIETAMKTDGFECFAGAYESLAGDFVIVYSESGQSTPRYRIYDGSSWSAEGSLPTVGATINWIRLVADPLTNQMLFACLDSTDDLNTNVWSGLAWGTNQELETTVGATTQRKFDLAYVGGTSSAVILYGEGTLTTGKYRWWTGSWSAENDAMNQGEKPTFMTGITTQVANQIFFATSDEGDDLTIAWSAGMTFATPETTLGGDFTTEPYMMAAPGPTPPTPANTSYATDFQGSIGAEWSNSTNTTTATNTKFLGRFYSDAVRLALNTTPGETYSLTFDLYAMDSWDGEGVGTASWGPDRFVVKANGATIFSQSFSHEYPTRDQSYPFPPDQYGSYAFNSSYQDGIYRCVEAIFTATCSVTTLAFSADFVDTTLNIDNESWGIDNVKVASAKFLDVSTTRGFTFQNTTSADTYGGGISWADLDSDGDLDCILSGGTGKLILNTNAGQAFASASFPWTDFRAQTVLLDVDNDGDLDVWTPALAGATNESCVLNNGSASFGSASNLGFSSPTTNEAAACADVNADGWPDVVMFSANNNWIAHNQGSTSPALVGTAAISYGLNTSGDYGDGDYCSMGDVNNDDYPDFFYHYSNGKLFLSDGDGTYTTNNFGISVTTAGTKKIGSAWADYDNDGDLDLYVPRNDPGYCGYLWRDGVNWATLSGTFANANTACGVNLNPGSTLPSVSGMRTCAWGDIDNDGDLDLLIAGFGGKILLYQNNGDDTFTRIGAGIKVTGAITDAVFVDYDNDGDLDLSLSLQSANSVLFENRTNDTSYLKVRLVGRGSTGTNKAGIGTRVELWNSAGTKLLGRRDLGVARGYGGAEPLWLHFGGVTPATSYQLKVYFNSTTITQSLVPSSVSTIIGSRTIPQMVTITEPSKVSITRWYEVPNKP